MRYIDSAGRDPMHALGSWLKTNALNDPSVTALRWQTGFFSSDPLGYFAPLMTRLRNGDGVFRVLLGSNDGTTLRRDVAVLLTLAGPARSNQRIGIVKFGNAYFHPKTIHMLREDGSSTAYVGSANVTKSGVTSLHIEAGLILDSNDGDDATVLAQIAGAVDWWFEAPRSGLELVAETADLDRLSALGVLDVPRPAVPRAARSSAVKAVSTRLAPLVGVPALPGDLALGDNKEHSLPPEGNADAGIVAAALASVPVPAAEWKKPLSRSDAQRKGTGHQRGSITLTKSTYDIEAQTYFREDFFGDAEWVLERTRTGEVREAATISFAVNIRGRDLGVLDITVTYARNRQAGQGNYTSLVHLGPLAPDFAQEDLSGRSFTLRRSTDGSYALSIL